MKKEQSDTHPKIQKMIIEGYRKMTPQEKMKQVDELTKAVQQMALARIQKQYGDISEQEQRLRLASLWLDRETMIKVFNWDPEKKDINMVLAEPFQVVKQIITTLDELDIAYFIGGSLASLFFSFLIIR